MPHEEGRTGRKDDFGAALIAVAGTLTNEAMRSMARKDAEALIASGVRSFESMVSLIGDEEARDAMRDRACWFAGRLGRRDAATSLLLALRSGARHLRWAVAGALACLGAKRSVRPVIDDLLHGRAADLRAAAAYALGHIGDHAATTPLLQALGNERESGVVRGNAAEALDLDLAY
jgi:HEAT repeat protein